MRNILALALLFTYAAVACGQEQASADVLLSAAQARQAKYERVRVVVKFRQVWEPGSVSEGRKGLGPAILAQMEKEGGAGASAQNQFPKESMVVESTRRLSLSGANLRYEDDHPAWGLSESIPFERISTTNAERSKFWSKSGPVGSAGTIYKDRGYSEIVRDPNLIPLMYHVRGASAAYAYSPLAKYRSTGHTRSVGSARHPEYIATVGQRTFHVWIDTEKNNNVVGFDCHLSGKLEDQCAIEYRTEGGEWIPTKWKVTHFINSKLNHTTSVEVVEIVNDAQFKDSEFDFEFPPRCRVHDEATHANYTVDAQGNLKPDNPADGDTIPQSQSWLRRHLWRVLVASLAASTLCVLVCIRRRRASNPPVGV